MSKKVGIISCSGEELAGGTLARLATLKVLNERRPNETVTLCLPLFLAGGVEERAFAKAYPTITVDGCDKRCAFRATERLSGKVNSAIVVNDVIGEEAACSGPLAQNQLTAEHAELVDKIADAIEVSYTLIERPSGAKRIRLS